MDETPGNPSFLQQILVVSILMQLKFYSPSGNFLKKVFAG